MTMLTHTRGPFERAPSSSARPYKAGTGTAKARLSTIRRFLAGVLTILAAGTAVAAIMALKIAIYLPRFIHQ
jgi:hypothetical protein